jgi:3-methyladenine DNA glycosylase/8-oxoguanine DNA glycosylase
MARVHETASRSTSPAGERVWRPAWPVDVHGTLRSLQRGGGDPTYRRELDGTLWRTCRTPDGPATLRLVTRRSDGDVLAAAWGPGAGWVLEQVPPLLGAADDVAGFAPSHPCVASAWHRHPGWRVPQTGLVLEALVPAVIEQLVTGAEAFGAWRMLLHRFGEPAPGPAAALGMRVVPSPAQWAAIPSWEWLRAGVDGKRSGTVVRAVRHAGRLEQTIGKPSDAVDQALQSLPGVGVWTSAEVRQRAHGDADAVSFGDYHVAKDVGWALTGSPVDDDGLAELLEPYRPHRYRVQRLLELDGARRPRRGSRMSVRTHLPVSRSLRPAR